MCSVHSVGTLLPTGFPIRTSTGHHSLAALRRFSQLTTSFFGSWRQGIHHMPFLAWPSFAFDGLPNAYCFCLHLYNFQRSFGGDERIRTADPLLARQVLSQLSYIPFLNIFLHNSALVALFLSHLHLGKLLAELRQAALIYTKILFNINYNTF